MAEEFLRCQYSFNCPLHSEAGDNMVIRSDSGEYRCIMRGESFVDMVPDCTYLHQLEETDKQTALLEKILVQLSPRKLGEINSDNSDNRDHP